MTIKQFAALCGCSTQTLRYYDKVELLKPVEVDSWTGYRYYEEEQALVFVKIKHLQKAGFTIEEIRPLLEADNSTVCRAFDAKIEQTEERLREIRMIRASYQSEMNEIQRKISEVREKIMQSMNCYDPTAEFGIGREQYDAICGNVEELFDNLAADPPKDIGYVEFGDGEAGEEEEEYLDLLHNPNYEIVYEKHSWEHVKDFFDEFDELEDGAEYALLFQVTEDKERYNTAFGNTILGILLARNPNKRRSLTCSMGETADGANHFWLLKKNA